MVQLTKTITANYVGVPTLVESFKGHVENLTCGDYNTYAVVKI